MPSNCNAWIKFAELEKLLFEYERTRAIFELAIEQPVLDMPELLWKSYIDFEMELEEYENVRALYKRLLERTKHVKVWISCAQFESKIKNYTNARKVFDQACNHFKSVDTKEERLMLVEKWVEFENSLEENAENIQNAQNLMPKKIKKKRIVKAEDGSDAGWEEYYDYIFPDEQVAMPTLKILEIAHRWKKQKQDQDTQDE